MRRIAKVVLSMCVLFLFTISMVALVMVIASPFLNIHSVIEWMRKGPSTLVLVWTCVGFAVIVVGLMGGIIAIWKTVKSPQVFSKSRPLGENEENFSC